MGRNDSGTSERVKAMAKVSGGSKTEINQSWTSATMKSWSILSPLLQELLDCNSSSLNASSIMFSP